MLVDALQVKGSAGSLDLPRAEVTWRGTRREVAVVFGNVRDPVDLPDEMLRADTRPRVVIDFPWDAEGYHPSDDRTRAIDYRRDRSAEWTAVWLPNFFTKASLYKLGQLVRLDYILSGENFDRLASYLAPNDRPVARTQLNNLQSAVREQVFSALRQAYGVDPADQTVVEEGLAHSDQFIALDPALSLRPPVGTTLRDCFQGMTDQLLTHRFPKHPEFTDLVSRADLVHTLEQVERALQQDNGRLENVDPPLRKVLTRVTGPLQLGTMYQAHFVADMGYWKDLVERRRAEAGASTMTVGQARRWVDGEGVPGERRGLTREVADLVVLLVAAATNRALVSAGQPLARPELGRLQEDWELRPQELPSPAIWQEALRRAGDMGVVPASTLLSAAVAADLSQRVRDEVLGDRAQHVRDLLPRLEAAYARFGLGTSGDRLQTAQAAAELVDALARRPDHVAEVLAGASLPTTAAALGTSIKQADAVSNALVQENWQLLGAIGGLGEPWKDEARRILDRLSEALLADELAVPLPARLRDATSAATGLLSRAATPPAPPAPLPPKPFDLEAVKAELARIQGRLREAGWDMVWELRELPHEG